MVATGNPFTRPGPSALQENDKSSVVARNASARKRFQAKSATRLRDPRVLRSVREAPAFGAPLRRLAQDDAHGVKQVHRHADAAGGGHALAAQSEHSPHLKRDQRGRDELPWV